MAKRETGVLLETTYSNFKKPPKQTCVLFVVGCCTGHNYAAGRRTASVTRDLCCGKQQGGEEPDAGWSAAQTSRGQQHERKAFTPVSQKTKLLSNFYK